MAGYRYTVFAIMLCLLSALGISRWCCPDDEIVPTCGRGRLPVRADICAIRLCCNVFVEMRREDASGCS
jgi:hypothetical protein